MGAGSEHQVRSAQAPSSPLKTAVFLVSFMSVAQAQIAIGLGMCFGMLATGATFVWMEARTSVDIGLIAKVLWFLCSALVSLVAGVLGGLSVGLTCNTLAKKIRREPSEPQKLTISKEGIQSLLTGFVPWSLVGAFCQLWTDGNPMRFWELQISGMRHWNLVLDERASGTDGDLSNAIKAHWDNASAACHDDGLPRYLWAIPVQPRLWNMYLRFFPFLLFSVSAMLFFLLRHLRFGDEGFLALLFLAFAWCAWKVWGDVWFQWATGLEYPQPFLIRNAMLLDSRGAPLVVLRHSQWTITTQRHGPWGSEREILTFRGGAHILLQLSAPYADLRGWNKLKEVLLNR